MTVDADGLPAPRLSVAPRMGMITAPYKRELSDLFGDMANVLTLAKDQSGTRDIIGKMDEIRRDSPFRPFFVPPGAYRCNAPLPVIVGPPLSIYGCGSNGDGPADYDYVNATRFVLQYAEGDAFSAVTNYPCHFEGFRIEPDGQYRTGYANGSTAVRNTGAGISISGNGGNNAGSVIRKVGFLEKDIGIKLFKSLLGEISMCSFVGWGTAGIQSTTDASREGAGGFIFHNRFYGGSGTLAQQAARGPCIFSSTGYIWIYANNMSGGQYGVYLAITSRAAGAPRIFRNTIEDFWITGVYAGTGDGSECSMLDIEWNEFSLIDDRPDLLAGAIFINEYTKPWLKGWSVSHNRVRNNQQSKLAVPMIAIRGGVGGKANDNRLTNLSQGAQAGMVIVGANTNAALGGPIECYDTQYYAEEGGSFLYRLACLDGLPLVRDPQPLTIAQLGALYPNLPAAGSSAFVSDGSPGSAPLVGGGEGTRALVANGRWVGR